MSAGRQGAFSRMVKRVGAVEVAPDRYAVEQWHEGEWYICSGATLLALFTKDDNDDAAELVAMPHWWEPTLPVLVKTPSLDYHYGSVESAREAWKGEKSKRRNGEPWAQILTVDLVTGEEVPA